MTAAARAPTAFECRVYEALRRVPRGRVTTYAALARAVGIRSARAIGQALRRNPFAPEIPCHRVIASDGTIGGFNGRREGAEVRRKMLRLIEEGVRFEDGRLTDPRRFIEPSIEVARPPEGPPRHRRRRERHAPPKSAAFPAKNG